jgi:hypothetical protein
VFTSRVETCTARDINQNDLGCQRVGLQHPDVSNTPLHELGNDSASPKRRVFRIYAAVSPEIFYLSFLFVWDTGVASLVDDVSKPHSGVSFRAAKCAGV